jgi:hypothetical protein
LTLRKRAIALLGRLLESTGGLFVRWAQKLGAEVWKEAEAHRVDVLAWLLREPKSDGDREGSVVRNCTHVSDTRRVGLPSGVAK